MPRNKVVLDRETRSECAVESATVAGARPQGHHNTRIERMPSTIEVKPKTVQDRDVISFRKEYGSEEHEVLVPTDQATQVLLSLLSVLNDGKDDSEQFVLARKGDLANGDTNTVGDDLAKATVVKSAVRELYDDDTAKAVQTILNGGETA